MRVKNVLLVLILSIGIMAAGAQAQVRIGQLAPDFQAPDSNGQTQSLSQYQGRVIVLEWYNSDCPFVKKHYDVGNMQAIQDEYAQMGVVWLMVNSSAPGKQGHYSAEEFNEILEANSVVPTALVLDPEGEVGRLYGAQTTPHMFIIDSDGILVYQGAIDDNPSANSDDIPGAKNYVRAALNAVLSGQPVAEAVTKAYGCSVKY